MHTKFWFPLILFGLVLLLAACGDDVSENDAEDALRAAFEGDYEQANSVFCADDQVSEASLLSEGVIFKEVTCQQQGGTHMQCITTFETSNSEERQMTIVFRITDDQLLCGPLLQ
jgi:hypothetical protein